MQKHFLHISDIHCGYDNFMVSNLRDTLAKEIHHFVNNNGQKIDYLFITGDLKFGKNNPINYPESTVDFINELQKTFNISKHNTFIVPGNHDITRGIVRTAAIEKIKDTYSSNVGIIDQECIDILSQTMCEFKNIYSNLCGREYKDNVFFEDLGCLNVIHLNTALICGNDNEDGSLIIGMSMLKTALSKMDTNKPAIVLGHHSFDCLSQSEQIELERFLKRKNAILYLCGHKHVTLCSNISTAVKNKDLWQFLCGTNMDQDPTLRSTDMDVFVGMLDVNKQLGYIDAYKWSAKSNHWIPDSDFSYSENQTTNGRIYYPSRQDNLNLDATNRYLHYLQLSCSDIKLDGLPVDGYIGSKKIPINSLYVPIKFKRKLTIEEELEAKFDELFGQIDDEINSEVKSIKYEYPIQKECFNSVILAGPGCGKSTFVKKIINYYSGAERNYNPDNFPKLDLLPVWIKCRSLNTREDFSIIGIIKDLPFSAEFPIDNEDLIRAFWDVINEKLLNGKIILLIDGLDEISDTNKRNLFINQIDIFSKQYTNNRVIITSRIAGYDDYNNSGLNDFYKFQIQEFDNDDIKLLCLKWHASVINSLEETKNYAEDLADTIIKHDRIRSLAENPLLLTTLLLVQKRVGRLPTKRIALYEESVKVLLETWNQEGHEPMDMTITLCQLAYIAFSMTLKGIQQINKEELISLLYQAKDDLSRILKYNPETPEQFIKRTEQRSSIITKVGYEEDRNGVLTEIYEFQHLTFQEYLASFAIVNKYYPNAKRSDTIVNILTEKNSMNALKSNSKKDEIILLTAALSGWDAEDIVIALIDEIKKSKNNKERINDLSRLAILLLLDEPQLEIDIISDLLTTSLFNPTSQLLYYYISLFSTKYRQIVKNIFQNNFNTYLNTDTFLAISLLPYLSLKTHNYNKLAAKIKEVFYSNKAQYNKYTTLMLKNLSNLSVSDDILSSLFLVSVKSVTREKAKLFMDLLNSSFCSIFEKIAEEEFAKWIIGTNEITYAIYILIYIKEWSESEVLSFFKKHKFGSVRDKILSLYCLDVYCWLNNIQTNDIKYKEYLKFVWECIDSDNLPVCHAAVNALSFFVSSDLSLGEAKKVINVLNKILQTRKLGSNSLYLYSYMPLSKALKRSVSFIPQYKNFLISALSDNSSSTIVKNAILSAMLLQEFSLSEIRNYIEQFEFDESSKRQLEQGITSVFFD